MVGVEVVPVQAAPTVSTLYYSYSGPGDTADWTLTGIGSGSVPDHYYGLPGGITLDLINAGASWEYSYPNLHGDTVITANGNGTRASAVSLYDPFGDPIDESTWRIGTLAADGAEPSTGSTSNSSYGTSKMKTCYPVC